MGLLNAILIFEAIAHYRRKMKQTKNNTTNAMFYCGNKAVTITINTHQIHGTVTKDFYKADFDIIEKILYIWNNLKIMVKKLK
jgi:hypothetical protein